MSAKILVADDDPLVRNVLRQALVVGGYDVVAAADGGEAIAHIDKTGNFDVVVTDHAMPASTGIDVISHALSVDPTLPCIIVTAHHDLDLAMKGMQAGAVGFITKPFKVEHLLRKPQRLTPDEMAIIRAHPEIGAAILEEVDTWEGVRDIVRHHHERFDGEGYPYRLKGTAIPLGARIVSVVDAYDVMLRGRPYAAPRSAEEVVHELEVQSG
ncbi:MAG TPA: HD domain-containing phosphohydrolase, partial [Candidatus Sulfotelmatobacter sp.]|nr:HD domain-containing phosphohydrolase [Candidatus Sulfotelmatobacter sp.]